ncbi:GmrSD restriction endonuclease domain-containing protein [Pseudarthrobacter sp. S9]|uniref:GmrSD restriction endonuclease domain-containing protein n=1 Tax=Pseudarthrobacter sp. S9 TaxID=3418421 RepID=UPI003CFC14C6
MGAVDWIACGLAGLLLVSTSACASPGTAPAAARTAVASPTVPAPTATATPMPGTDGAPLDPETTPGVTLTGVGVGAPHQQPAFASKALDVLATLPVKGRAPKTGYSREQFGQAWADVDRNGCDTRNDMLRRDLTALALKLGTRDCVVLSGVLNDPYTATAINFLRGNSTSTAVQIDHVVALSDAWQKGAQQLSPAQRLSFANDPLNLLAVDGPTNIRKSDGDAATWLPPNKSYRCDYVARQISVKSSYGLWVTQAEHDAMARVLADCPDALAPTDQGEPPAQEAPPVQQAAPAPAPAQVQMAPAPVAPAQAPAYYANCAAVRAAGAAPIHVGQPGYSSKLDRDGDGVGCE